MQAKLMVTSTTPTGQSASGRWNGRVLQLARVGQHHFWIVPYSNLSAAPCIEQVLTFRIYFLCHLRKIIAYINHVILKNLFSEGKYVTYVRT